MPPDQVHREAQGCQGHSLAHPYLCPCLHPKRAGLSLLPAMGEEGGKRAFVTVGTTKFDALIEAMDSLAVADELAVQGFSRLVMQVLILRTSAYIVGSAGAEELFSPPIHHTHLLIATLQYCV